MIVEALKALLICLMIIIGVYVAIRVWTYGLFRSYFMARKESRKENGNAETSEKVDEGKVSKEVGRRL